MSTYRYYTCTAAPSVGDPLWHCRKMQAQTQAHAQAQEVLLDTEGVFTGIGWKGGQKGDVVSEMAYDWIRKTGCLASIVRPAEVRAGVKGLSTLHVGIKSWVPDSLDILFVAGNLPGGVLIVRKA